MSSCISLLLKKRFLRKGSDEGAQHRAQQGPRNHVGGEVDIEVESRKSGQKGEDIGEKAQTLIDMQQNPGADEGGHRMSRRK